MKILQINTVCGTGSTGRIATDLYKVYEKAGYECVIAYGRGNAPDGIKSIKIGSNLDMYMHGIKTRVLDKHGFGSIEATKSFIKEVKKYNPDVIHLHNIHGYYINIEILFKYLKESGKKIIWTLHDCWSFTGHCSHFEYIGCEKWKNECKECLQKKEYPSSKLLDNSNWSYKRKKELFTSIDKDKLTIVTPSKWLANLVKQSYLKKYEVEVIHNGIDLNIFKPTESDFRKKYNLEDKKVILGVASVWTEKKGLNYFIKLANELDDNYKIVLVGVNKKQKKKLSKNIVAIERTNDIEKLVKIYSSADVFFNPTLEDNFPTTNLEALACGIPVITFDTGGSIECIDKLCGIIVNKGDIKSIYKNIIKILNGDFLKYNCMRKINEYEKNDKFKEYIKVFHKDNINKDENI